jgi:hypothetical protein
MKTAIRRIAVALSAALIATTALTPLASAQEWHAQQHRQWQGEQRQGHDDSAALIGLGLFALVGAAIIANAAQAPAEPAYAPQPAYAPPAPICTTINGYAACIGPDGTWQYVR